MSASDMPAIPHTASITFRGEEADVEFEYDCDPAVGIDGVGEWWFVGDVPADWAPTEAEYGEVARQLTQGHADSLGADDYPFGDQE